MFETENVTIKHLIMTSLAQRLQNLGRWQTYNDSTLKRDNSVTGQILLNAPAEMVSWTYSIRSRIPQDVWTNSLPVMVWQGAPAKLDRPYAYNATALR